MNKIAETYATIDIADLPLIDFAQVGETDQNTIRKSLDGTKFIIKFDVAPTFILDGSVEIIQAMNHGQAVALMQTDEWNAKIEE